MCEATPGPWHIMWAGQDDFTEQECIDEEMPVVAIPPAINYAEFAKEGTAEERANARLISAAPDLYEAAKVALGAVSSRLDRIEYEALEKAIAKAEGREDA